MSNSTDSAATVMVVDDEQDLADMYAHQLGDRYEIRTAYGGQEALDTIDEDVDIVLLDRRMPEMSGDEVLEAIRERDLPCSVIMVTAVDPDFDVLELPFDEYLCKPVSRDELVGVIEQLLKVRGYDDAFREYLTVTSKLTLLEVEKTRSELERSEPYANLERLADELEDEMRKERDDVDDVIQWLRGNDLTF